MTRRWSLITVIVGLAVALTFVLVNMATGAAAPKQTPVALKPVTTGPASKLKGVGWWPAHEKSGGVAADQVGHHNAVLQGGASWTNGPQGGALLTNGTTGYADTGATILDTTHGDYSVAAWVRLDATKAGAFYTAVSEDGDKGGVFYLQYSGTDKLFSFSFTNARALATGLGEPQLGRWYHLVGTYSHDGDVIKIYVDGVQAGRTTAHNLELPSGHLVIGRGKFAGKPTDFWNGAIADVHVYDRALSPSEVATLAVSEPR